MEFEVVPLRRRPDLRRQTAKLLNTEWPRSLAARYEFLRPRGWEFGITLSKIPQGFWQQNTLGNMVLETVLGPDPTPPPPTKYRVYTCMYV